MLKKILLSVGLFLAPLSAEAQISRWGDTDCAFSGDGTASTCAASNGAVGAFRSLSQAEANITTNFPTPSQPITVFMAGATADTTPTDINGQTLSAANFLTFTCDPNKATGCNNTGVWSNSTYRLVTGHTEASLKVQDEYVRIIGLQIENNGVADAVNRRAGIEINNVPTASDVRILGNIIRFTGSGSDTNNTGIYSRGAATLTAVNNLSYGWTGAGILLQPQANGTAAAYNNTFVANGIGVSINSGASNDTLRLYNNASTSNTTDYGSTAGLTTLVTGNNVSGDATSPDVSFRSRTISFLNLAGRDLRLNAADTAAKNQGTGLAADSFFAFTNDIINATRPISTIWDVGAFEEPTPPGISSGATVEICANGVDDIGSGFTLGSCPVGWRNAFLGGTGCDKLCKAPDQDNDGYSSTGSGSLYPGIDCDDTNEFDYPGKATSTDGGATYRVCNSNGTYTGPTTSSVTPYTAPGCLRNYYINPTSGNNTNSGTFASPWQTLEMVCDDTGARPSGAITLTAGDCVYNVGSGVYSTLYVYTGTDRYLCYGNNKDGTAANPIQFMNYPGATVLFNPGCAAGTECGGFYFDNSDYVYLDGIRVTNVDAHGNNYGHSALALFNACANNKIERSFVYENSCNQTNNCSGIKWEGGGDNKFISTNYVYNNRDKDNPTSSAMENNTGITGFTGKGHKINFNRSFYTTTYTATSNNKGVPLKILKHSASDSNAEVYGNILWNCNNWSGRGCISSGTPNITVKNNLCVDASFCLDYEDMGGPTYLQNALFENNTAINASLFRYIPTTVYGSLGVVTVRRNITSEAKASYAETFNLLALATYEGDAVYNSVFDGTKLNFNNNCYYNSLNAALTGGFCASCGTPATTGALYNFSGWTGFTGCIGGACDQGSFNTNPNLEAGTMTPSGTCSSLGWNVWTFSTGASNLELIGEWNRRHKRRPNFQY